MKKWINTHDNAAGYSIVTHNLKALHAYANKALKDIKFNENTYQVQFKRTEDDYDISELIEDITNHDNVWGTGVPEPRIYIEATISKNSISIMGQNKDTLKIIINGIPYIKFHAKDMISDLEKIQNKIKIKLVGRANMNEWRGKKSPQIFIDDYEIKESTSSIFDF